MLSRKKSFLLLQGPCSPFSARLADRLADDGHHVHLLNFNGGDLLYRRRQGARLYRGSLPDLPEFLQDLYRRDNITDQVLFGDQRPVHRPAVTLAPAFGVRTQVLEEGYFRPHWITMEPEGVNARSTLPGNPDWFLEAYARLGDAPAATPFNSPFRIRATHDVLFHLAGLANPALAPHYRNHAPVTAPLEYAAYLKRFSLLRYYKPRDARRIESLVASSRPYFVLPLQLNGDAQIQHHSPYRDMLEVIDRVMTSFARRAPGDARLVIKNHPLDMGLVNYARHIRRKADELAISGRVVYLESGDLNRLLPGSRGMVTVNSTAGLVAMEHGCPTLSLGQAIYALPGLVAGAGLDAFWQHPEAPDPRLFHAFRQTLLHTVQLNGGFYCRRGIDLAVAQCSPRLAADLSPLEELLQCLPKAA